ncbi:Arylsulfatase A [Lutibacter oricola]|uniref:Arylsulfatase A n=1 Tax=Lutibacter oricola TaxID=762486 RepID=A0A1H3DTD0_9FLAO|nr:sulfatase-like hydrolase/transferase [Lutibacter oricola]SDX69631.1 Arylsulfatase A [Lutibacter oricola]
MKIFKLTILLLLQFFLTYGQQEKKPNIIFLMIDDCSAVEFSCYATSKHPSGNKTPVIDALAKEGVQFTTCWASPLCMPARAMLMSGKYGSKTGVFGNKLSNHNPNFAKKHKPMSKVLKDEGYETAISGKWHLPGNAGQEEYGFDEYSLLGGYFNPFESKVVWDGLWFSWSKPSETFKDKAIIGSEKGQYPALYWNGCVINNGELQPSNANTFAPDICQKFALDFIKKERDKPFFLYYPMVLPHDPWFETPIGSNTNKRSKPGFSSQIKRLEYYVDELVQTLKDANVYDNTIIFFTADNATLANGKGSCSELGVRVPLIVFGGALKNKGVSDVMVDFTDMYPTVLEVGGIDTSGIKELDGVSFKPVLENKPFKEKPYVFSFLDLERTVRTKNYMMDGHGGIWKCATSGNLLDYIPLEESKKTQQIRIELTQIIESFKLPSIEMFGEERIEKARGNYNWPSFHSATLAAYKNGDNWMFNKRRLRE